MATDQPKIPDQTKAASHGRGGAGNINNKPLNTVAADDLQTPTLKSGTYTTGRGGSGNMATNSSAEEARRAQDVDTPVHHSSEPKGTFHWGRGGEGNMMTVGGEERAKSKSRSKERTLSGGQNDKKKRSGSFQDAMKKGKEMLGLKGKVEKNGSAIADD